MKYLRKNESPEQSQKTLAKYKEYYNLKKQNESIEDKQLRLEKLCKHRKDVKKQQSLEERIDKLAKAKQIHNLKTFEQQNVTDQTARITESNHSNQNLRSDIENDTILRLVRKFHSSVSTGPLYICSCCDQLWYKHSVSPADRLRLANPDASKYLQNIKSVNNIEWLCQTCSNHLKKGKVPPCAIANGMRFPERPNFFDLNELECRLIAPRLAFQKIFQAPRGGQLKITGNVVNVPADVNNTVSMLPRLSHDTGTIKVQLKRRLQYKSSALSLNIRPNKVMQAAIWWKHCSKMAVKKLSLGQN
jgi:hypothetical protein